MRITYAVLWVAYLGAVRACLFGARGCVAHYDNGDSERERRIIEAEEACPECPRQPRHPPESYHTEFRRQSRRAVVIVSATAALVVVLCLVGVCVSLVGARRKRRLVRPHGGVQLGPVDPDTGTATGRPLHSNAMYVVVGEPCGHGFVAEGVAVQPPAPGAVELAESAAVGEPHVVVAVLDDLSPAAAAAPRDGDRA